MRKIITLISLALVAAACSGGTGDTSTTTAAPPPTTTTTATTLPRTDDTVVPTLPPPTTTSSTTTTIPPDLTAAEVTADVGLDRAFRSLGVVAGDFDGDGAADLLLLRRRAGTTLDLLKNKAGVLRNAPFPAEPGPRAACDWGDVQGDGLADLYCAVTDGANELWIQAEDGTFSDQAEDFGVAEAGAVTRAARFALIDGDDLPDLVVANAPDEGDDTVVSRVYLNEGGASFAAGEGLGDLAALLRGNCLHAADLDGDGRDEILDCAARVPALKTTAEGFADVGPRLGFRRRGDGVRWLAIATGDANGDGATDIAFVSETEVAIHLQAGGRYDEPTFTMALEDGWAAAFGDADGDGNDDLYVVQRGCGGLASPPDDGETPPNAPDLLLRSDGAGNFAELEIPQAEEGCGDAVAALDLDGDGTDEFVVLNGYRAHSGPVQVISVSAAG